MKSLFFLCIIFFILCSHAVTKLKGETSSNQVVFETIGNSQLLTIKGKSHDLRLNLSADHDKISGEIVFRLESLTTEMLARDQVMKEKYLEVKSYPEARLVFTEFQMPAGWTVENPKVTKSSFRAKFYLHGVERELTGQYSIEPKSFKINAEFEVKLSDYKIETPKYEGVKVADFVKINVTIDKMVIVKD